MSFYILDRSVFLFIGSGKFSEKFFVIDFEILWKQDESNASDNKSDTCDQFVREQEKQGQ